MPEEAKPKRKYQRRKARVEPLAVYAVMASVPKGRKIETIYAESARFENGVLILVSMDGPPPLVEKTHYIPLTGNGQTVTVCARPRAYFKMPRDVRDPAQNGWLPQPGEMTRGQMLYTEGTGRIATLADGPRIEPGPLEIARQREAQGPTPRPRPQGNLVERNADGVAVVTAGFGDERPT